MTCTRSFLAAALLAFGCPAFAQHIGLSPGQIENLGIRFEAPQAATASAAAEATASVVVPPSREAVVGTPLGGLLTAVHAAVGDQVARGAVLAELSSAEFLTLQREFLDALNAWRLARSSLARDRQLHDEGIIAGRRVEETTTRSAVASAALNEHRQLLAIAGLAEDDIRALEQAQRLQPTLKVRSPLDGDVVARMATTGERLDAMAPLYRIADLGELWLEIDVPQELIDSVRKGMAVRGVRDDFRGSVIAIGRGIDPLTQTGTVRARVAEHGQRLSPGQFVSVRFIASAADQQAGSVWTVPAQAVMRSAGGRYLFLRSPQGVRVRRVEVVNVAEGRAFLAGEFDGTERVAVSGISVLKTMWAGTGDAESE